MNEVSELFLTSVRLPLHGMFGLSDSFLISILQSSLNRLMELLGEAQPFFVRCIRSNAEKVCVHSVTGLTLSLTSS